MKTEAGESKLPNCFLWLLLWKLPEKVNKYVENQKKHLLVKSRQKQKDEIVHIYKWNIQNEGKMRQTR